MLLADGYSRGPVKRVMIADDHDVVRRGVKVLLEARPNLQLVAEASNGREAVDAARETRPDIAILDYSMPELNGYELTIALKRELPRIEILIYTMHHHESVVIDVLRAGARGFILKSEPGEHLFAAVEALAVHRPYFSGGVSEALLEQFLKSKPESALSALTHRERMVVQLIAEGKINKQIGGLLDISVKTVETHRAAAMHKLKLRSTAELVRYAIRNNMIEA
jgi:DNA-binding NarL/FixJ family response regulator